MGNITTNQKVYGNGNIWIEVEGWNNDKVNFKVSEKEYSEMQKVIDVIDNINRYYNTTLELEVKLSVSDINKLLINVQDKNTNLFVSHSNKFADMHNKLIDVSAGLDLARLTALTKGI